MQHVGARAGRVDRDLHAAGGAGAALQRQQSRRPAGRRRTGAGGVPTRTADSARTTAADGDLHAAPTGAARARARRRSPTAPGARGAGRRSSARRSGGSGAGRGEGVRGQAAPARRAAAGGRRAAAAPRPGRPRRRRAATSDEGELGDEDPAVGGGEQRRRRGDLAHRLHDAADHERRPPRRTPAGRTGAAPPATLVRRGLGPQHGRASSPTRPPSQTVIAATWTTATAHGERRPRPGHRVAGRGRWLTDEPGRQDAGRDERGAAPGASPRRQAGRSASRSADARGRGARARDQPGARASGGARAATGRSTDAQPGCRPRTGPAAGSAERPTRRRRRPRPPPASRRSRAHAQPRGPADERQRRGCRWRAPCRRTRSTGCRQQGGDRRGSVGVAGRRPPAGTSSPSPTTKEKAPEIGCESADTTR